MKEYVLLGFCSLTVCIHGLREFVATSAVDNLCSVSLKSHDENSHHCMIAQTVMHTIESTARELMATCSRSSWLAFCRVLSCSACSSFCPDGVAEGLDAVSVTKLLGRVSVSGWVVILSAAVVLSEC